MKIRPSEIMSRNKRIEIANTCIIAKDGPNLINKMGLDFSIPFDSVLTTRQTLKSETTKPIMYGFLGTNITFLLLSVNYHYDVMGCPKKSQYLEYYFEGEEDIIRTFTDILVFSGNEEKRIPQIYIHNPNNYDVVIDIFAANLDDNIISDILLAGNTVTKFGLFSYTAIRTDEVGGTSTQFDIYETKIEGELIFDSLKLSIPYNQIDTININENKILIKTINTDDIELVFLNEFNANQAFSRMMFTLSGNYATKTYPAVDTNPPTLNFISDDPEFDVSGVTTKDDIIDQILGEDVSGYTITDFDNEDILRYAIIKSNITLIDVNIIIIDAVTGDEIEEIIDNGKYYVKFVIKDYAGNQSTYTKIINKVS